MLTVVYVVQVKRRN